MLRNTGRAAALTFGFLLLAPGALHARPAYRQSLAEFLGPYFSKRLNDCRTCHLPDGPGDEKRHNPFGARLRAVKEELRKAGKRTALADRLEAIANEDSDGDGVANLLELLAGRFPGDPDDTPTATELQQARQTLTAFLKSRGGYPWRPFETVRRPPLPGGEKAPAGPHPLRPLLPPRPPAPPPTPP